MPTPPECPPVAAKPVRTEPDRARGRRHRRRRYLRADRACGCRHWSGYVVSFARDLGIDLPERFASAPLKYDAASHALTSFFLMFGLPLDTWLRLAAWLAVGLAIYFTYSAKHSRVAQGLIEPSASAP